MNNLTICIPTYNNAVTISLVLDALNAQGENLIVKVFDNGSRDGTKELVEALIRNNFFMNLQLELIDIQPMASGRIQNIPFQRYKISHSVDTEFLMFLDSDVLLTPTAITNLMKDFNGGMMGIRYEPRADHVQMGATLLKTEVAKTIEWRIDAQCECLNAIQDLLKRGLKTEYHPWLQARHIKYI